MNCEISQLVKMWGTVTGDLLNSPVITAQNGVYLTLWRGFVEVVLDVFCWGYYAFEKSSVIPTSSCLALPSISSDVLDTLLTAGFLVEARNYREKKLGDLILAVDVNKGK
jgi:hypothetical protein